MDKADKRQLHVLRTLQRKGCLQIDGLAGTYVLLKIPGERTIKVPSTTIKSLASSGAVTVSGKDPQKWLLLTEGGVARLRRAMSSPKDAHGEQHRVTETDTIQIDGEQRAVSVNRRESPIWLMSRAKPGQKPWLSPQEAQAAERIRKDFEFSQMAPRVTASWDPAATSSARRSGARAATDASDFAMAASDRLYAAVQAIGPELSGVVLDVCCFLKGLEMVEHERNWPRRSAKLMLRTGLAALARHYDPPRAKAERTRHWGAQDYKPALANR